MNDRVDEFKVILYLAIGDLTKIDLYTHSVQIPLVCMTAPSTTVFGLWIHSLYFTSFANTTAAWSYPATCFYFYTNVFRSLYVLLSLNFWYVFAVCLRLVEGMLFEMWHFKHLEEIERKHFNISLLLNRIEC